MFWFYSFVVLLVRGLLLDVFYYSRATWVGCCIWLCCYIVGCLLFIWRIVVGFVYFLRLISLVDLTVGVRLFGYLLWCFRLLNVFDLHGWCFDCVVCFMFGVRCLCVDLVVSLFELSLPCFCLWLVGVATFVCCFFVCFVYLCCVACCGLLFAVLCLLLLCLIVAYCIGLLI